MDNIDDLFEQAILPVKLTPADRTQLQVDGTFEVMKRCFTLGYLARDQRPRRQLAALLRAPS